MVTPTTSEHVPERWRSLQVSLIFYRLNEHATINTFSSKVYDYDVHVASTGLGTNGDVSCRNWIRTLLAGYIWQLKIDLQWKQ